MTINEKISQIKKTIEEIKNITKNLSNETILESKIEKMRNEILMLKKGIGESIDELDEILGDEDARS